MGTITLSESAVAILRWRMKGQRMPLRDRDLLAYRELVDAGRIEPTSEAEFRLTTWGTEHGEAILDREWWRIEPARHVIPDGVRLSIAARDLLRASLLGDFPDGDDCNRPAYRELAGRTS